MKCPPGQLLVTDSQQASALGTKQRLDDNVASEQVERRKCLVRRLSGPGCWHRQARTFEQGQRQVLVNGCLDGPGRIQHRNPERREPMQRIHPKNDLLQASRRHHPHQHAVGRRQIQSANLNRRGDFALILIEQFFIHGDRCRDCGKRNCVKRNVESAGGALEVGDMPARARDQSDQGPHAFMSRMIEEGHRGKCARMYAALPVSMFWNTISAGLKRWGSTA